MTTPHNPAQALSDASAAISEAVVDDPTSGIDQDGDPGQPPRVAGWRIFVYAATMFGFQLTLLLPSLFSLAYKAQVLDPAGKDASLGLVLGVGGVFGLVAGPVLGVISDGTRWSWGRRRPFIALGLALAAVGATAIALAPTIAVMAIGWAIAQLAVASVSAGINPFLAEQVPESQRGKVGALGGAGAALAGVSASLIGSFLTGSMLLLFLTPVAVFGIIAIVYLMTIPDEPAPPSVRIGSILDVFTGLWFNPIRHSDFALVWIGKLVLQFGFTFFSTYQLYFMLDRLGLTAEEAGRQLAALGGLSLLALVGCTIAGGFLSDRFGRRKPFIYLAAALIASGLLVLSSASSIVAFAIGGVLLSAGTGAFNSVDLAMATDVLPEKDKAGKYMGIYYLSAGLGGTIAPVVAPVILHTGGGGNYPALFITGAVLASVTVLTAARVRSVR